MKKLLLLLTLFAVASCTTTKTAIWDTCPSDEGYSCPEDGSPCPFCNDEDDDKS